MKINIGIQNEANRIAWLKRTLKKIPKGARILDAGAGEQPYKKFCQHLKYTSQDFGKYNGKGDSIGAQNVNWKYKKIDIISDITSIPKPDGYFDAIMCTEVFEHLPNPIMALKEFSRLLRSGGYLIITSPFCSLTHFSPYFYYSGFAQRFYETYLPEYGFKILRISPNGNYFEYLGQEMRRLSTIASIYAQDKPHLLEHLFIKLILRMLERFSKKDKNSSEILNFGYHVLAVKTK